MKAINSIIFLILIFVIIFVIFNFSKNKFFFKSNNIGQNIDCYSDKIDVSVLSLPSKLKYIDAFISFDNIILDDTINNSLKELNIRNTFLAFDNFKQDFITAEHIKGIGTAEIQMQASWKPGFIFEKEELKVKSHLVIEQGELIQFKPLETILAAVVFPTPLTPLNKKACATLFSSKELLRILTIASCPIKSLNVFGLYLLANTLY